MLSYRARSMTHIIINDLQSLAQKCKATAGDCSDADLSEFLQEIAVVFRSFASVLEDFDR